MNKNDKLTIVAAVNNKDVLQKNLLFSPEILDESTSYQVIIKENYSSASIAYNSAIDESKNDIVIFAHQDIYLPEGWFSSLWESILYLNKTQPNWGVLGCYGCKEGSTNGVGKVYTNGIGQHGDEIDKPESVDTLDEIILIIRKSSGLRFDSSLPHFHLYGTDICLSAIDKGMKNYAIPAFCIHNTNQLLDLPKEFYECFKFIKNKWFSYLPIYTPCITISRFDKDLYLRNLRISAGKLVGKKRTQARRVDDPRTLLG
ncbi:MAG: hypothetical protein IPN42_03895 [Methylococcaceae bacterium]|nr:hypothetical protein [Methylococcaceae bacterium]